MHPVRIAYLIRVLFVMLIAANARPAQASSSLAFEGGGYWIDMEIGDDGRAPAVARVIFHAGDDAAGVVLQATRWQVEAFDPGSQRLRLRHFGAADVAPFVLDVARSRAVLRIDRQRIEAPFDWDM